MITRKITGFTVVEILIVIVVIGILAGLSTVGYRGMQMRAANTTSMSDGSNAAEQIELAFLKAGKFPANEAELSSYAKDVNTDWEYTTNTGNTAYCLEIWNIQSGSKHFTVRDDKTITEGTCTGWVPSTGTPAPEAPAAPSPTIASVTTNAFGVSWPAVPGATSYTVNYGTASPSSPATGCVSTAGTSCTISGLSPNTTYYVNVAAINSGGSTPSSQLSTLTRLPSPGATGVTFTVSTVKKADGYNYERYVVTASGGACSIGTIQWQTVVTGGNSAYWGGSAWVASNVQTHDVSHTGIYSAFDVTIYAKARCIGGSNTSADSNTVQTFRGTGGGAGGSV